MCVVENGGSSRETSSAKELRKALSELEEYELIAE